MGGWKIKNDETPTRVRDSLAVCVFNGGRFIPRFRVEGLGVMKSFRFIKIYRSSDAPRPRVTYCTAGCFSRVVFFTLVLFFICLFYFIFFLSSKHRGNVCRTLPFIPRRVPYRVPAVSFALKGFIGWSDCRHRSRRAVRETEHETRTDFRTAQLSIESSAF